MLQAFSHLTLLAAALLLTFAPDLARGGEFRATATESRLLEFLDRNGDGRFDPDEFEQFPVPMRRWLRAEGIETGDGSPSLVEFGPSLRAMLHDLRDGQHSTASSKRASNASTPRTTPRSDPAATRVKSEWTANGSDIFRLMDRNRDGKLDENEWGRSQKIRYWFEADGRKFNGEMSQEEFVEHMVDIQRRLEDSEKD